jgi:hypothetical protein
LSACWPTSGPSRKMRRRTSWTHGWRSFTLPSECTILMATTRYQRSVRINGSSVNGYVIMQRREPLSAW